MATGREEVIPCGLVIRSIGYRGRPLPGVPFDERRGLIRNTGGRVCGEDGEPLRGEYAVGWIKRGPSGVIGTNKKDAADTVARIVEDAERGALGEPARADAEATAAWLRSCAPGSSTWDGWEALDAHERRLGEPAAGRGSSSSPSTSWSRRAAGGVGAGRAEVDDRVRGAGSATRASFRTRPASSHSTQSRCAASSSSSARRPIRAAIASASAANASASACAVARCARLWSSWPPDDEPRPLQGGGQRVERVSQTVPERASPPARPP